MATAEAPDPLRSRGVVVDLCKGGCAVVKADSGAVPFLAFTFDKIDEYRGESCREIGLYVGREVEWWVDAVERRQINRVRLLPEKRWWRRVLNAVLA